jgi:hypothetical protein
MEVLHCSFGVGPRSFECLFETVLDCGYMKISSLSTAGLKEMLVRLL